MKRLFQKTIFLSLFLIVGTTIKAQDTSYACLGTLCTVSIDIDLYSNSDIYLKCTIPTPEEEISGIYGPCAPKLVNNLGDTVELWFMRNQLLLEIDGDQAELVYELLVNKWSTGWGSYSTTDTNGVQCYYIVTLLVTLV